MLHPRLLCVPVSKVCPRLIASSWLTEGLVGLLYFQTVGEACDSGQEKNASDVPCSSSVYNQHPHPHPCHQRITILTSRGAFFKGFFFFFWEKPRRQAKQERLPLAVGTGPLEHR